MIQGIYIKNFRAWRKGVFKLFGGHTVFLGDNDTGKTSILEALDYFFNHTKMDSSCYIDPHADIHIGVRIDGQEFRRRCSRPRRSAGSSPAEVRFPGGPFQWAVWEAQWDP